MHPSPLKGELGNVLKLTAFFLLQKNAYKIRAATVIIQAGILQARPNRNA